MSMKDNFYQAVKELLNKGGLVGSDLADKAKEKSDLDSYLNTADSPSPSQSAQNLHDDFSFHSADRFDDASSVNQSFQPDVAGFQKHSEPYSPDAQPAYGAVSDQQQHSSGLDGQPYAASSEVTIISKNTVIEGSIHSFANISVEGNVKGNINCTKSAYIAGKIVGDITCSNLSLQGASMQGNITSKGEIVLDNDSLVLGDLSAQYAEVDGRVKGNITLSGKAELKSNAVVLGNIRSATISISEGANVQGFVNTSFLQEQADSAFPGQVTVNE